jgi:hypothetical protein
MRASGPAELRFRKKRKVSTEIFSRHSEELVAAERKAIQRDRFRVVLFAAQSPDDIELTREQIAMRVGRKPAIRR